MSKVIKIPTQLIKNIVRPDKALMSKLSKYSTTIISDCLQRFSVMDAAIKPVFASKIVVGPAVTVEEIEGGNLMSHFALNSVQAGDVLVIDQKRLTTRAGWGGLQTYMAKKKKIAAVIIDGAVRDVKEIRQLKVPVFTRAITPAGPHKGWGGNVNTTISCGGVSVAPGDIIVADDDGVVVVKPQNLKTLLEACKNRADMEKQWYQWVTQGKPTTDFLKFNEKLEEFGVQTKHD